MMASCSVRLRLSSPVPPRYGRPHFAAGRVHPPRLRGGQGAVLLRGPTRPPSASSLPEDGRERTPEAEEALIRPDIRGLDDLIPFLGFAAHVGGEFRGRALEDVDAGAGELGDDFAILYRRDIARLQLRDD